jgi:sarcosine oxidase subunit gamma
MVELTALRESPLAHLKSELAETTGRPVRLIERAFSTMISIRVELGGVAYERISGVLGAPLPAACGATSRARGHTTFWLGPDEWLIVSDGPAPGHDPLVTELTDALGDGRGAVVDVSANRTTLELGGERARAVLEKGCPVDLHPSAFFPGRAVLTTVGPIPVLLWQVGVTTYRVFPRSSFADYVARWLLDAMREYDGPAVL